MEVFCSDRRTWASGVAGTKTGSVDTAIGSVLLDGF